MFLFVTKAQFCTGIFFFFSPQRSCFVEIKYLVLKNDFTPDGNRQARPNSPQGSRFREALLHPTDTLICRQQGKWRCLQPRIVNLRPHRGAKGLYCHTPLDRKTLTCDAPTSSSEKSCARGVAVRTLGGSIPSVFPFVVDLLQKPITWLSTCWL